MTPLSHHATKIDFFNCLLEPLRQHHICQTGCTVSLFFFGAFGCFHVAWGCHHSHTIPPCLFQPLWQFFWPALHSHFKNWCYCVTWGAPHHLGFFIFFFFSNICVAWWHHATHRLIVVIAVIVFALAMLWSHRLIVDFSLVLHSLMGHSIETEKVSQEEKGKTSHPTDPTTTDRHCQYWQRQWWQQQCEWYLQWWWWWEASFDVFLSFFLVITRQGTTTTSQAVSPTKPPSELANIKYNALALDPRAKPDIWPKWVLDWHKCEPCMCRQVDDDDNDDDDNIDKKCSWQKAIKNCMACVKLWCRTCCMCFNSSVHHRLQSDADGDCSRTCMAWSSQW